MTTKSKVKFIGRGASLRKRDLLLSMAEKNPRQVMLDEIKQMMGNDYQFHLWFDRIYVYRAQDKHGVYEGLIRRKYNHLLKKTNPPAPTPPDTSGMSALKASCTLSDWLTENWAKIPEVSY